MEMQDILTLARAGFTAQQIAALSQISHTPQPEPTPAPQPAPNPAPAPQPHPEPQPQQQPQTPEVNPIIAALGDIKAAINAQAINNTQQPKEASAYDMLAAIINPPRSNP